jgi:hypothetical protein
MRVVAACLLFDFPRLSPVKGLLRLVEGQGEGQIKVKGGGYEEERPLFFLVNPCLSLFVVLSLFIAWSRSSLYQQR